MATSDQVIPSPIEIPVRPLTKGMILNIPANRIPAGGFLDVANYRVTPVGLTRRSPYLRADSGTVSSGSLYRDFHDLFVFWESTGSQHTVFLDNKFVYTMNLAGDFTRYTWDFDAAVNITVTGTGVEAAADVHWNDAVNEVRAGDVLAYDTGGTTKFGTIASITDGDTLVLASSPGNYGPGANWVIYRAFGAVKPLLVDWTVLPSGQVLFADGTRALYSFDGTDYEDFLNTNTIIPACVVYFNERVWMGRTIDGATETRQRIVWSEAGDYDDFANGGYVDLPFAKGAVQRLVPLGKALIAYMEDAIFVGFPSNDVNLPVAFQRYETGGLGLVGMKAICAWQDRHFLVMQDNIYSFSLTEGLKPIGDPIIKKALQVSGEGHYWKIRATTDLRNKRVIFGLPGSSGHIEDLWSFSYETAGWSHMPITADLLCSTSIVDSTAWSGVAGAWSAQTKKWINYVPASQVIDTVYFSSGALLYRFASDGDLDTDTNVIAAEVITPDMDLENASLTKTWLDFGLKLEQPPTSNVTFEIFGSVDRGLTWKGLGAMTISTLENEGRVSFRLTGACARFRIQSLSQTDTYTISEYTMRVRGLGKEIPQRD